MLLVVGLGVRFDAVVSLVLLAVFVAGIASAARRGPQIDCGCFGAGGDLAAGERTAYTGEIGRDAGLRLLAGVLVRWPVGRLSVDERIRGDGEVAR